MHSTPRSVKELPSSSNQKTRTLNPTLRANPFPEVTDLFRRLPLPTLFRGPEPANLGDLMRLWVRSGVQINLSFGFSRAVGISKKVLKKKRQRFPKLLPALPNSCTLPYVTHVLVGEHQPHSLSRHEACVCGTPLSFRID